MHHRIVDRSVLIFDDTKSVNYAAVCGVFLYGDTGFMHSMNGTNFYKYMSVHGAKVMDDLHIVRLEGYCMPAHVRLMKMALRQIGEVVVDRVGKMAGKEMVWVIVKKRSLVSSLLESAAADETLDIVKCLAPG